MHLNTGEQGSEEDRAWLISVVPSDRPADNGHKLNYNKIYLNLRNKKKGSLWSLLSTVTDSGNINILEDIQNLSRQPQGNLP